MKLYHGTNIDFSEIDFKKCKPNKDFGRGFYLTDNIFRNRKGNLKTEKIMKQNDNKIEFIINCDVEKIVSLLEEDYGMNILDAFDTIYNSKIYKKLTDTETGLYIQSPLYIYEYLKEEIGEPKMVITPTT